MNPSAFDRFCYKYRRLGIRQIMRYIIAGQILVFVMHLMLGQVDVIGLLDLRPSLVLRGEIWRLVTVLFVPQDTSIFFLFWVLFYYWVGSALESFWGAFKLNFYLLTGLVLIILCSFVMLWAVDASLAAALPSTGDRRAFLDTLSADCSPLYLSLLLALGTLAPNEEIRFFGVFPIKLKWLALFYAFFALLPVLRSPTQPFSYLSVVCIGNYLLYFGPSLYRMLRRRAGISARAVPFKAGMRAGGRPAGGYKHKCAECGVTDTEAPDLEFRYCSLCSGYQCYCARHIFGHEHRRG